MTQPTLADDYPIETKPRNNRHGHAADHHRTLGRNRERYLRKRRPGARPGTVHDGKGCDCGAGHQGTGSQKPLFISGLERRERLIGHPVHCAYGDARADCRGRSRPHAEHMPQRHADGESRGHGLQPADDPAHQGLL